MRILLVIESGERYQWARPILGLEGPRVSLFLLHVLSRWDVCQNGDTHTCSKVNPFINLLGKTFWILRVCSKRYQTTNCGMVGDLAVHSVGRSRSLQFLIFRLCWEAPFFPVLVPIPSLSVPTFFSHSDLKLFNPYRTNVENRVSS